MLQPLNVLNVLVGDAYPPTYVDRLARMLDRNLGIPYVLHCVTDRPNCLPRRVVPIHANTWSHLRRPGMRVTTMKLGMFGEQTWPHDEFMYLDVTLVVQRDLKPLLDHCQASCKPLTVVKDWNYEGYNSCVMYVRRSAALKELCRAFVTGVAFDQRNPGDQDFIYHYVRHNKLESEVGFFRPEHVVSYRNLRHLNRHDPCAAHEQIRRALIVKFYGRLKMHHILHPYHNFAGIRLKNLRCGAKDATFWTKELRQIWR